MKLSRRVVALVVALIVVSLSGLVLVQVLLLQSARGLKEQAFRNNVLTAMGTVVRQLETREAAMGVVRMTGGRSWPRVMAVTAMHVSDSALACLSQDSALGLTVLPARQNVWVDSGVLHYRVPSRQRITIEVFDSSSKSPRKIVDSVSDPGTYKVQLQAVSTQPGDLRVRMAANAYQYEFRTGDAVSKRKSDSSDSGRIHLISRVFDNLTQGEIQPIEKRLNLTVLDSLLAASLASAGIDLPYQFGVVSTLDDSLRLVSSGGDTQNLRSSDLRSRLFPSDVLAVPGDLTLFFPGRAGYVVRQLVPLAAATSVFMLLIAACFVYSIVTILRQRRFAQQTVDFINNMTHEFKTPLSTVALACDALARPDIAGDSQRVGRYEQMIRDENARMRSQVDKILQMAVLEEGDYELNMTELDVHEIIHTAARGLAIQVEHRNGSLILDLQAQASTISADRTHLTNIVANLLDNANKYSGDRPEIAVATRLDGRSIVVTVSDKGVGISSADLAQVFRKYYRARTGNRHDVKGFGIGLTYVKLMTEAMGGRIELRSRPGEGTSASIVFPLAE